MDTNNSKLVCVWCDLELMFLETSALTGENVEEAFVQCARKILNKIESGRTPERCCKARPLIPSYPKRMNKAGPCGVAPEK